MEGNGCFYKHGCPLVGINLQTKVEEVKGKYDHWASEFDKDMVIFKYQTPATCVNALKQVARKNGIMPDSKIVDVGAGTGIIGEMLKKEGYKNIDAVDVSSEMLNKAKSKNCYKKLIESAVGTKSLPIASNEYDVLFCIACLTLGHIKPNGIDEMVEITKHGGILIFTVRHDADEKYGFKQKFEELQAENKIDVLSKDKIDYYANAGDNDPARYCFLYVCLKK